jgi:hypothetical protein
MDGSLSPSLCLVASDVLFTPVLTPNVFSFRVSPLPSLYGTRGASTPPNPITPPLFFLPYARAPKRLSSPVVGRLSGVTGTATTSWVRRTCLLQAHTEEKKNGKRRPQYACRIHPFACSRGRRATLAFAVGVYYPHERRGAVCLVHFL